MEPLTFHSARGQEFTIRPMSGEDEARACATLMAGMDPWVTLQRGVDASLHILRDSSRETYVVLNGQLVAGFLILCLTGAFVGYLQTIAVAPQFQGQRIGTRLIEYAEQRIFSRFPNVFLCVSSFNTAAQRLYLRLGYSIVGELKNYIVEGHSEILLRKTRGPLNAGI